MTAPKLTLPIWALVKATHEQSPPQHPPCDAEAVALVFTTTERVISFLKQRESGEWKVRLVSYKDELAALLADLHSDDAVGICLDAQPDGSGGVLYTLDEFAASIG